MAPRPFLVARQSRLTLTLAVLRIKPVSFACEFFTVLDHGRRARLCIGRFTQEKGAASSFYKVFDTLETVLHSRDLLVDDDTKRRAMEKALRV